MVLQSGAFARLMCIAAHVLYMNILIVYQHLPKGAHSAPFRHEIHSAPFIFSTNNMLVLGFLGIISSLHIAEVIETSKIDVVEHTAAWTRFKVMIKVS